LTAELWPWTRGSLPIEKAGGSIELRGNCSINWSETADWQSQLILNRAWHNGVDSSKVNNYCFEGLECPQSVVLSNPPFANNEQSTGNFSNGMCGCVPWTETFRYSVSNIRLRLTLSFGLNIPNSSRFAQQQKVFRATQMFDQAHRLTRHGTSKSWLLLTVFASLFGFPN